jgi:hypothetical protein
MNYNFKTAGFDAALLFRTKAKTKWTIYGGIGANVGFALNSNTNISNIKSSGGSTPYYSYYLSSSVYEVQDVQNNKTQTAMFIYHWE